MASGIVKKLSAEDKRYYTCADIMAMEHIGETKARKLYRAAREMADKDGLPQEYPRGRVPKQYYNKLFKVQPTKK